MSKKKKKIFKKVIRKARKNHVCENCKRIILKDEKYEVIYYKYHYEKYCNFCSSTFIDDFVNDLFNDLEKSLKE